MGSDIAAWGFAITLALSRLSLAADDSLYREQIKPLLREKCFACHSERRQAPEGGLRLDHRAGWLAGGDTGPALVVGKPDESLLIQAVERRDGLEMPPEKPLTPDEIALLREWIAQGAIAPESEQPDDPDAATARWALAPLVRPEVPGAADSELASWGDGPIDCFIREKLSVAGLRPSPEADRATLIRRLSFDVLGLPPTIEEIDAFVADPRPDAYERLVDQMLASPRHGERWARHWLDVVHFGETHGYDKDQPRPRAWPYRDYVVRSFNADKPYARFVQEQIAGDAIFPGTRDGIEALGFLSAGPWDLIGHAEVPETKTDGKIARHLDRDDVVTNTIQTFCGLTIQCAQCHDHKFDPITQRDYYSLQAVFAAIDRTERAYDEDDATAERRAGLMSERDRWRGEVARWTNVARERGGVSLADLEKRLAEIPKTAPDNDPRAAAYGWHSGIEREELVEKWVQVDLGDRKAIASVVLQPCRDEFNNIGEGFGFPVRFRIDVSNDPNFGPLGTFTLLDRTASDFPNPKLAPVAAIGKGAFARYVRATAVKLAPRQNDFIFSLAELQVFDKDDRNLAAGAVATSGDSIEAMPRWGLKNLTDGWYPGFHSAERETLRARLSGEVAAAIDAALTPDERDALRQADAWATKAEQSLAGLPPQTAAYIGSVHTGAGAFRGTGPDGGKPRPIHLLHRGNILSPGELMAPGVFPIGELPTTFLASDEHPESERRASLAQWIVDPSNPLPWRVMANRLWQHHFGVGLAPTANDLGRNGQRPSHRELLDWLACELREHGSLKRLHRAMLLSATYRQGSAIDEQAFSLDADNRWLGRMPRRKLEAEAIRDAILTVSGRLDLAMGGPSFQDFVVERPEHSPHYQYHLHDPDDLRARRRSIYRFAVRSQQQPFMKALDCADPSMQVDRRNESLSPQQALVLVNDRFALVHAKRWAERLAASSTELENQVATAFAAATGRRADAEELSEMTAYAREHGLANLCRTLFSLNEFVFVD